MKKIFMNVVCLSHDWRFKSYVWNITDTMTHKNQSAAGAGGLGIIKGKKVGETE